MATGLTFAVGVSRAVYPHDIGQYDGSIWAPADLLAHGHSPYYKSLAFNPPYVIAPYGPAYYAVIAAGVRVFGTQFWFGRGLSLVCLAICMWLVYVILSRTVGGTLGRKVGLVGGGLLAAQYPVQAFIGTQRPDFLALALALSGLTLAFFDDESVLKPVAAGILLALAILARQTLFLPLLVAVGWYTVSGKRSHGVLAALSALSTLAIAVGVLSATSDGGFIWHAVRLQLSVPFTAAIARGHLEQFVRSPATVLTLVLLASGVVIGCRARGDAAVDDRAGARILRRLLGVYLAAAVAVALVASGKAGSNVNYWLEVALVLSMLSPLVWAPTLERAIAAGRSPLSLDGFTALAVLTFLAALVMGAREAHGQLLYWRALRYTNELVAKLDSVTSRSDPVIADDPDIAVSAGRRYYFNDISTYALSPLISGVETRVVRSRRVKAIATLSSMTPAGYVPVCLSRPIPTGVYASRLYVLAKDVPLSGAHCAAR